MLGDIQVAFRTLRKHPGFFAIASLTLAVGTGANTAVFSLFEALVLRTLPVERPGELAVLGPGAVGTLSRSDRPQESVFSYAQYEALRKNNNGALADLAAAPTLRSTVYWGERPVAGTDLRRAPCMLVTGSYFPMLGVRPFLGRLLVPSDDGAPGSNPVAVVSYAFWKDQLGEDPHAVGSTIRLHGAPYEIVGITERSFRGHTLESGPEIWVPMSMQSGITRSPSRLQPGTPYETYWLNILMRLNPGVDLAQAQTALNLRLQQVFLEQAGKDISDDYKDDLARMRIPVTAMNTGLSRIRTSASRPLMLLWASTALVLIVACANLGSLLLVRAAERRHEFAVRQALGASRVDLLRPFLAESAILACAGTSLGCALAYGLIPMMRTWVGEMRGAYLPLDARLAWPELSFAAGVGILTVFLFGLAPSVWASRATTADALKGGTSRTTSRRSEIRARGVLVAGQCALALVLLTMAGLFLKTLAGLRAADLGIDAANVIGIWLDPRGGGFPKESQPLMRRRILERVMEIPGVESSAFTGSLPLDGDYGERTISVSGYVPGKDEDMGIIHVPASPRYFETLGIQLLRGRVPGYGDANQVVVNQAFADRFFPDGSALGGVIGAMTRIVGVVANVRQVNPRDEPPPLVYRSTVGYEGFTETVAVRSSASAESTADAVRRAVRDLVPGMPIGRRFSTIEAHLTRAVAQERLLVRLVGAFACVALLLSGLGLFGVCSHVVRNRTAEIGVRMALGATRRRVQALVLRRAASLLACGAAVGLLGAVGAGRLVSGMLFEVRPFEWEIVGYASIALAVCGCVAATVPALRAGRVRPSEALRHD